MTLSLFRSTEALETRGPSRPRLEIVFVDWQGWYTLTVVGLVFAAMVRGLGPPDMLIWAGAVLVGLAGIVTVEELVSGFANPGMLTVGALFVVAAALRETGALDRVGTRMLGRAHTERGALLRVAPQVAGLSAFLNNTAVVAMTIPVITDWCRKRRISPSRLLLPVSYFAIVGGMCTLIGTSTNLIVNSLMIETAAAHDDPVVRQALKGFGFFELGCVGLPLALVGATYLLFVGRRLLPDRKDLLLQLGESSREYLVDMLIEPNCPLVGKGVEVAGLRHLPGLFLIEIMRGERLITPVEPDEILQAGDRLTFTGVVSTIVDLERIPGFVPVADEDYQTWTNQGRNRRYCEAVISNTSPLIGKNIRDANFRARYNAAIVAVHRGAERLAGRIGDIVLRPGDTLLLQAGPHFAEANRNNPGFFLVSSLEEARPVRHARAPIAAILLILLVFLMVSGTVPIVIAAFAIAGLMIATRCISASDARRVVQWDVLLTIAAAFGLGKALTNSGAADAIGRLLVDVTGLWGPIAALAAVYLVTTMFTELITNNTAAVLIFPLAVAIADQLGLNPRPFAIAVAIAASASFATPIGYQTNLMVYGPGGYRFSDFLRVGLPLNILLGILAVLLIPLIWPLELA